MPTIPPLTFFCDCDDRQHEHVPYTDDELEQLHEPGEVTPRCVRCHEPFRCGECGYEIDQNGDCQRPEGHLPVGE